MRRIFQMAGGGMSVMRILRVLNRKGIPTPSQLKNKHREFHKWWVGVGDNKVWDGSSVVKNYRTKKNSREEWVIVEDCHEIKLA